MFVNKSSLLIIVCSGEDLISARSCIIFFISRVRLAVVCGPDRVHVSKKMFQNL